jgi:hypothetical protein
MHSTGQGYPKIKNKVKDTQQDIITIKKFVFMTIRRQKKTTQLRVTSKRCLYDNTAQSFMRKDEITTIGQTTTQLLITCSNIFTRLHRMAFINYQDRLSWNKDNS